MGVIDHIEFRIACPECGATETTRAVEYGSSYGSGGWSSFRPPVQSFAIVTKDAAGGMPWIKEAACNECGAAATVETVSSGP